VLLHNAFRNVKLERIVILPSAKICSESGDPNIPKDKCLSLMEATEKIVYPLIDWFSLVEFDNN
jgi:hypothetical protein